MIIYAIILGIVEGITEFLPISSTGHLILTSELLKIPSSEFWKSFEIAIQLGAILSVVVLYWKKIFASRTLYLKVLTAFIPTAIIGLALYKIVKSFLLGNVLVVLIALLAGGILMIIFENWYAKKKNMNEDDLENISYKQAGLIGIFQALAVIPGVSRSAATVIGGLLLGLNRKTIIEFSFLLAVPTMAAATGLDLMKSSLAFSQDEWIALSIGFVVSFLVALLAIKFLLKFIKNHTFKGFGWYRIILATVWLIFILL